MQYDVKGEFPRILSEYIATSASASASHKFINNNNITLGLFYNGRELTQSDTAYELDMTADAELVVMMHRKSDGIQIDLN